MQLLQAIVNGAFLGGVYSLISVGLALVFGVMEIVNFAQAEFLMIGMFGAYVTWELFGLDPLVSAVIVGVVVFLLGALVERYLIEPIIHTPPVSQVFLTVGISIFLQNIAAVLFGTDYHSVQTAYQTSNLSLGGLSINVPYLLAFCYAVIGAAMLYVFLEFTELGRAMRATSQNRQAAVLMGINPRKIYMTAFGIGVGFAALAGAAILPYTVVSPTVGQQYVLIMFTVVVLGGLNSIWGVFASGLLIGVLQSVSALFLPTELQNLVVFIVFVLALIIVRGGVLKHAGAS